VSLNVTVGLVIVLLFVIIIVTGFISRSRRSK
jgi:hypothetical protein